MAENIQHSSLTGNQLHQPKPHGLTDVYHLPTDPGDRRKILTADATTGTLTWKTVGEFLEDQGNIPSHGEGDIWYDPIGKRFLCMLDSEIRVLVTAPFE